MKIPPYRLLVTGSPDLYPSDRVIEHLITRIYNDLNQYGRPAVFVYGDDSPASRKAAETWKSLGGEVELHVPNYAEFMSQAPFVRNQEMVNRGADLCLAFLKTIDSMEPHCLKRADAAGIMCLKVYGHADGS